MPAMEAAVDGEGMRRAVQEGPDDLASVIDAEGKGGLGAQIGEAGSSAATVKGRTWCRAAAVNVGPDDSS